MDSGPVLLGWHIHERIVFESTRRQQQAVEAQQRRHGNFVVMIGLACKSDLSNFSAMRL